MELQPFFKKNTFIEKLQYQMFNPKSGDILMLHDRGLIFQEPSRSQ